MLNDSTNTSSTDKKPEVELRNLVLTYDGETVSFVNKRFFDELAAEVRLLNSRNSMLKQELAHRDERIAFLIQQASDALKKP
jgi:hypothetical protein